MVDRDVRPMARKLSACGGVGCLRETCVRANSGYVFSAAAFRDLPAELQFTDINEDDVGGERIAPETDEHGLAEATRAWAESYVRPALTRPLTSLHLPRIDRPAVMLEFLRDMRAEVCVVNFTSNRVFVEDSSWWVTEPYHVSCGSEKPCPIKLLPPSEGISALIVNNGQHHVDWDALLKKVPRLQYLSMRCGPWDRYGPFSEALCRVPDLKCLDIGANGISLRTEEGGRVMRVYELLKHTRNLEIIRSTEGYHFTMDVVRTLKRTCCPHLREMHTDVYKFQSDNDCDGVIWKDGYGRCH